MRARRRPDADAAEVAERYAEAFALLTTTEDDLRVGLRLFEHHPALGAFDAVLGAVALNNRVEAFVSADRTFGAVVWLSWIDPRSPAFPRLLVPG